MGKRRVYVLEGETFATQAAVKGRIQQILWGTALEAAVSPRRESQGEQESVSYHLT